MEKKGANRKVVLPLLEEHGGVRPGVARRVAAETGVPEADVYGVASFYTLLSGPGHEVRVCQGLSCVLAGAEAKIAALKAAGTPVRAVSCLGQCDRAPAAIDPERELLPGAPSGARTPSSDDLAIDLEGEDDPSYAAFDTARDAGPDWVIEQLKLAGLQGRGGAGFPAHLKWDAVRGQAELERYVVVNADEGEPGTFKDREIMIHRPHLVIEGSAIAAWVAGASTAYIYVRGEFRDCIRALEAAIADGGHRFDWLDFEVVEGHGAYICGEETALLEAIEGRRGMPRLKPPYPTQKGLWGKPTLMNNVETLACVPAIIRRGGEWFRALGRTEPGTKLYCVSGHVQRPGIYELPLGVSLDELVAAAGGYVGTLRAFSPGGASSGFLPASMRDQPLDFGGLAKRGSMLGSAGVVVLNDTVDMAEAARWQQIFFEDESCGQCAPCRIGCRVQRQAIDRFFEQGRDRSALANVEAVAWEMDAGSICGLGMVASAPLTSALAYFQEDFGD
ncbi:NAD(P)H-dependent oxidoreductase subunit E [Pseudenhygromyxa sp. WMMC2535]|uniref:NADH-ubiquinone oxidoreductase-F iron-sulfur binding region domain-containing protein n=1 Tax=Pseudenhygromyxa sp. WMMC2535 TaxID=2712867 RepID=UPI001554C7F0|nr:NADH-ubiquinone oxidoreductase-F iron-sulfur binding region domain-containing protein [Pseudenhygromyxa sp. WMMC2535]NVB39046.1 NAD(P)H-dependent oxidoreductase subunit E [Pseudenhygromyxa sp. WMMC2535]